MQVKHYAPAVAVQEAEKASKILFTIFKATLAEYGIGISDVAGGTTDCGLDVKAMCTNILLEKHGIPGLVYLPPGRQGRRERLRHLCGPTEIKK